MNFSFKWFTVVLLKMRGEELVFNLGRLAILQTNYINWYGLNSRYYDKN